MKKILTVAFTLIILGLSITKMSAQCPDTARYTVSIDPANNGQATFTNTSVAGTGTYYHWDFGDGVSDYSVNPGTHTYSGTGTYTVCLSVYDSLGLFDSTAGCYNTYCSAISVINTTATCNASFYFYNDSTAGPTFVNTSSGTITNYSWDFGDGTTSTSAYPGAHHYTTGGYFTVCLTTNNPSTLCNSTFCGTVFVSSCTASFTYTPDATGNGVTFNGSSTGPATTYHWDFGDGTTSSLQNPYHVYTANGAYVACMTASSSTDSTCISTVCQSFSVSGLCGAHFYIAQDSLDLSSYTIYDYSSGSGTINYLWDFGDGSTSTLQYPSHTYATSGPYYLCLTVSDGLGCSDTHCDSLDAGHAVSHTISIHVVPLATGVQEQTTIISSLENYPNPFSDNTTIAYTIKQNAAVDLSIVDLLGNKIATIENENKSSGSYTTTWSSEGVANGMYLLQLKVNNNISTKKLVINK